MHRQQVFHRHHLEYNLQSFNMMLQLDPLSKTPQLLRLPFIPQITLLLGDVSIAEPNQANQPLPHLRKWSKDHPLDNIVGNPSRPVSTRKQLASDALWCCFHTELLKVEPKNFKMAVIEDCWFQAMQDEIHEFDRLEVWELVPRPIYVMVIALKWIYKVKLDEYGDVLKN
ncbi:gag-pol polyprotein [Tanacetum coccineum]|uniref:Gag-pol polyprotein n=1 Tax=Tanacetum coccineum TaxID=301880 RepID=A0ABQ5ASJ7_9ASTR